MSNHNRVEHKSLKYLIFRAFFGSFLGIMTVIILIIWSQKFLDKSSYTVDHSRLPSYLKSVANPHVISFFMKFSSYYKNCPNEIWVTEEVKGKLLSLTAMNHPVHMGSLLEKTICNQNKICYTFGYPLSILVSTTQFFNEARLITKFLQNSHKARILSVEQKNKHTYIRFVIPKAQLILREGTRKKEFSGPWSFAGVFRDYETGFVSLKAEKIKNEINVLLKGKGAKVIVSQNLTHSLRLDKLWSDI